jgi:hypothetical protein
MLRGTMIRLAEHGDARELVMARVDEMEQRMRNGKPDKATACQAYSGRVARR